MAARAKPRQRGASLTPAAREGDTEGMGVNPDVPVTDAATPPARAPSRRKGQQSIPLPEEHRARLMAYLNEGHATTEVVAATGHTVSEASVRRARDGKALLRSAIQVICGAIDALSPR